MGSEADEANVTQAVPFFVVSSMEDSLRFYVDGLGFDVTQRWMDAGTIRWCCLTRGGASLMLQDMRREGGTRWSPDGPLGLGVSVVFMCRDALAIYREVTRRGTVASKPFVGNGMWVTSLRDPDGYRVEFESATDVAEDTVFDGDANRGDGFEHAVRSLRRGDFSALAPLFDQHTPSRPCQVVEWYADGRFRDTPDALLEMFTCACFLGRTDVVRVLLADGVDPLGGAATGVNALHWSANRGQLETLKVLLEAGAPLEVRNMYGGTALGMAIWSAVHEPRPAHLEIIDALLEAGARRDAVSYPTGVPPIDLLLARDGGS